jgi:hypothetical protein
MTDTISFPEPPLTDDRALWDAWLSQYRMPALVVADELGLFARLIEAPLPVAELAARLSVPVRGVEALAGVLAGMGILARPAGKLALTPPARDYLLPDSPYYWGGLLETCRNDPAVAVLREAVRRDRRADAERVTRAWESGELSPERARAVTRLMHAHSFAAAGGVARWGDFSAVRRLLDVGGGSGCFCLAVATRYPDLRATVLELPAVCRVAEETIAASGLSDRVDTLSRNMFRDPWPLGYDAIFFSNVFHDWNAADCRALARRAFDALPAGGRVFVHEALLADARDAPLTTALFSMHMLVRTEGCQFTARELEELLGACGFTGVTVTPTYGYYSLVTGRKPEEQRR